MNTAGMPFIIRLPNQDYLDLSKTTSFPNLRLSTFDASMIEGEGSHEMVEILNT